MVNPSTSLVILSDTETVTELTTTDTTSTKSGTKKRIVEPRSSLIRTNRSHTAYFFRVEKENSNIAYCKICETNFAGTNKPAYGYNRKGGNTTNLITHLRDKHNITKENYLEFLDDEEVIFDHQYA